MKYRIISVLFPYFKPFTFDISLDFLTTSSVVYKQMHADFIEVLTSCDFVLLSTSRIEDPSKLRESQGTSAIKLEV